MLYVQVDQVPSQLTRRLECRLLPWGWEFAVFFQGGSRRISPTLKGHRKKHCRASTCTFAVMQRIMRVCQRPL